MNYKAIGKGCLMARFDVCIPKWGLTIRECCLFEKESKRWITLPNRQYKGKDGATKNCDLLIFDKPIKQRFDEAVIGKIDAGQFQSASKESIATQQGLFE